MDDAHRPWPAPPRPWALEQTWEELAFLHWRVDPAVVAAHVPAGLEVDTFDGSAWIGVVPFRMSGVRLRGLLPLPTASAFPELNVRTYVTAGGRAGVWFFSLDAASALAVAGARRWFHLPYYRARMRCEGVDGEVRYASTRTHRGSAPAELVARYRPVGAAERARAGSLEHFLVERYCLYAASARGLWRAEVVHPPWPLQVGEAEIERNSMSPIALQGAPLVHYAHRVSVRAWSLDRVS